MLPPFAHALLDRMRAWAREPDAHYWPWKRLQGGEIRIFPEDVTARPDNEQLLEFIRAKCAEPPR